MSLHPEPAQMDGEPFEHFGRFLKWAQVPPTQCVHQMVAKQRMKLV